jgi:hypothetical protein
LGDALAVQIELYQVVVEAEQDAIFGEDTWREARNRPHLGAFEIAQEVGQVLSELRWFSKEHQT